MEIYLSGFAFGRFNLTLLKGVSTAEIKNNSQIKKNATFEKTK